MAATFPIFLDQCQQVLTLANEAKSFRAKLKQLVDHHNANGFSTADTGLPAYVNKDANSNVKGLNYNTATYLSFINFATQFENLCTNVAVSTADNRTTIEQISTASQL